MGGNLSTVVVEAKAVLPPYGFGDRVLALYAFASWLCIQPRTTKLLLFWPGTPANMSQVIDMRNTEVLSHFALRTDRISITRNERTFAASPAVRIAFPSPQGLF